MIWREKTYFRNPPNVFRIKKAIWDRHFMRLPLLGGTILVIVAFEQFGGRSKYTISSIYGPQDVLFINHGLATSKIPQYKQPIFWRFFQCSPRTQPTFGGEVGMRTRAAWFVGIRRRCWSLGNWTWASSKSRGSTMVKGTRISWKEKTHATRCHKHMHVDG